MGRGPGKVQLVKSCCPGPSNGVHSSHLRGVRGVGAVRLTSRPAGQRVHQPGLAGTARRAGTASSLKHSTARSPASASKAAARRVVAHPSIMCVPQMLCTAVGRGQGAGCEAARQARRGRMAGLPASRRHPHACTLAPVQLACAKGGAPHIDAVADGQSVDNIGRGPRAGALGHHAALSAQC